MSKNAIAITIPVQSTVEDLMKWANRKESVKSTLESEALQEKMKINYDKLQNLIREMSEDFDEADENILSFEEYSENIKINIIGNVLIRIFSDMLEGKTLQETEGETILDDEWVGECIETFTFELWKHIRKAYAIPHGIVIGIRIGDDDDSEENEEEDSE